MKRDIYRHKELWHRWISQATASGIKGVSSKNSATILRYLRDMELGVNVGAGQKQPRAPARLNALRSRMVLLALQFQDRYDVDDLTTLTEDIIFRFFAAIHDGTIKSSKGIAYESLDTQVKIFKAFWHWHQKVNRKNGITIPDITADLGSFAKKPKWVYLTEEQVQHLCSAARHDYRVLFSFVLDSGIRPSGELLNIKVSDLSDDCKTLNIRDEIAKVGSMGRRIKLMLCSELVKQFIGVKGLKPDDYLFDIKPHTANKYIKKLTIQLFGDVVSQAGKRNSEIRLYDLRHMFTWANLLSLSRLGVALPCAYCVIEGAWTVAAVLFIYAVLSDFSDGYVARKRNEVSALGGLLDHSSDAFFVTVTLAAFAYRGLIPAPLPLLVAIAFFQYVFDSRALSGSVLRASIMSTSSKRRYSTSQRSGW